MTAVHFSNVRMEFNSRQCIAQMGSILIQILVFVIFPKMLTAERRQPARPENSNAFKPVWKRVNYSV